MADPGRLAVERFRAEYLVPAGHPAPGILRARLDGAARTRLARSLGAALERALPSDDEGICLIRRLHVDLEVEEEWDEGRIARAWASRAAHALARLLAAGEGSPEAGDLLRFPHRAAYLARFLADLAAGEAWGRWYYAAFDGLRPLPASAALRTAVLDRADDGLRALLSLGEAERARVLAALTPVDARRVLDGLSAEPTAETWTALWRAWEALPPHAVPADAEARTALELVLRAGGGRGELRAAARALVRLARLLAASASADAPAAARLLRALRSGEGGALLAAAPADADTLAPLRESPPGWVEGVARTLASASPAPPSTAAAAPVARATPFGAVFVLLPFLAALPLDEASEGWPAAGVTPAPAALRLLLACKALGAPRAARAFWDPVVRDAMGVGPALTPAAVRAWARALPRGALPRFLRTLAE
ncbi:MAG TPA: hypothetical protein VM890_02130, partial [Longimicrobium sp.]|nr:hypothetical protein [Longimicrobium sp.]